MEATRTGQRRKVVFKGAKFDVLVQPLGLDTREKQAAYLETDEGNYSKIRRGAGVGAIFVLRFHAKFPRLPLDQFFGEEDR